MDSYRRVVKPRTEESFKENELRITAQGLMRNYISYAIALFKVCVPIKSLQNHFIWNVSPVLNIVLFLSIFFKLFVSSFFH
jgi:hypothetical protein